MAFGTSEIVKLCPELNLEWTTSIESLGVHFDGLLSNMEINYDNKLREIMAECNKWSYRYIHYSFWEGMCSQDPTFV